MTELPRTLGLRILLLGACVSLALAPAALSDEPNSTMYWFATHPADPDFVVANSLFGYVYISRDAGESWEKTEREFGEVRALAWVPTPAA